MASYYKWKSQGNGGPVIQDFALAIAMGIVFGTYSTIYVATPTIILLEEYKPAISRLFTPLAAMAGWANLAPQELAWTPTATTRWVPCSMAMV